MILVKYQNAEYRNQVIDAVKSGELPIEDVDKAVVRAHPKRKKL